MGAGSATAESGFLSSLASGVGVGLGVSTTTVGSWAGVGRSGCIRIIKIDVPIASITQLTARNNDFQRRFMIGLPMQTGSSS